MTARDQTQRRREYAKAQQRLAWLERCAAQALGHPRWILLLVTPDQIAAAMAKVQDLERRLQAQAGQLELFG